MIVIIGAMSVEIDGINTFIKALNNFKRIIPKNVKILVISSNETYTNFLNKTNISCHAVQLMLKYYATLCSL